MSSSPGRRPKGSAHPGHSHQVFPGLPSLLLTHRSWECPEIAGALRQGNDRVHDRDDNNDSSSHTSAPSVCAVWYNAHSRPVGWGNVSSPILLMGKLRNRERNDLAKGIQWWLRWIQSHTRSCHSSSENQWGHQTATEKFFLVIESVSGGRQRAVCQDTGASSSWAAGCWRAGQGLEQCLAHSRSGGSW